MTFAILTHLNQIISLKSGTAGKVKAKTGKVRYVCAAIAIAEIAPMTAQRGQFQSESAFAFPSFHGCALRLGVRIHHKLIISVLSWMKEVKVQKTGFPTPFNFSLYRA